MNSASSFATAIRSHLATTFFLLAGPGLHAQVPQIINYQGRVAVNGVNFAGPTGQFKFALVDGGRNTNLRASATATINPLTGRVTGFTIVEGGKGYLSAPVVVVTGGGGSGAAGRAVLSAGVVNRIDVTAAGSGYTSAPNVLLPEPPPQMEYTAYWRHAQDLAPADEVPDSAVNLAVTNGLYSAQLGGTGMVPIPHNVFTNPDVRLRIWFSDGTNGFQLLSPDQRLTAVGYAMMAAGVEDGAITSDKIAAGAVGIAQLAPSSITSAHITDGTIDGSDMGDVITLGSRLGNAFSGRLNLNQVEGNITRQTVSFTAEESAGSGADLKMYSGAGINTIDLDAQSSSGGGSLAVRQQDGDAGVLITGEDDTYGPNLTIYQSNGTVGATLRGDDSNGGAELRLKAADGSDGLILTGDGGNGGYIAIKDPAGTTRISLIGSASGGARIVTQVLQITGGSDLSEGFEISAPEGEPAPGMVVSIDAANPGKLLVTANEYDRTVAGVISGAGGVQPGMVMGQAGTVADGRHPVALTGRVYCYCDATSASIQPGDLLTSSRTPGHAMKASDSAKAAGAIVGKAMTSLREGRGLVLVLVSLQ